MQCKIVMQTVLPLTWRYASARVAGIRTLSSPRAGPAWRLYRRSQHLPPFAFHTIRTYMRHRRKDLMSSYSMNSSQEVVTRENFHQLLPIIQSAVDGCSFYAFDCEFTGLHVEDYRLQFLDNMQDRYQQALASAEAFLVNQIGLSFFTYHPQDGSFTAKTFNVYLFPLPFGTYDRRFLSQSSSVAFLAEQGFDFNTWIREGVPFMPLSIRDAMTRKAEQPAERDPIILKDARDKEAVQQLRATVTAWLQSTSEDPLLLPAVNNFQRAVQYQELEKDVFGAESHPSFIVQRVEDDVDRPRLLLIKATPAEVEANKQRLLQQRLDAIQEAAGFSAVWAMLQASGKPAVGHNPNLDVAYCLSSFVARLPSTWEDYKRMVSEWFPAGLWDTKHLAALLIQGAPLHLTAQLSTGLGPLFETLQDPDLTTILLQAAAAPRGPAGEAMQHGTTVAAPAWRCPSVSHASGFEKYAVRGSLQSAHAAQRCCGGSYL